MVTESNKQEGNQENKKPEPPLNQLLNNGEESTTPHLRIEQLQRDLENEQQKAADISKRLLYLQSDYLNLQRQTERRVIEAIDDTKLQYLLVLISIKEDLERAMSAAKMTDQHAIIDGLRMLVSRVDGLLKADEVERIAISPGGDFDPRLHEAIAFIEGSDKKDGTVVSVVGNGYTMRGKVIKPALVEVSRENKSTATISKEEENKIEELLQGMRGQELMEKIVGKEHPRETDGL